MSMERHFCLKPSEIHLLDGIVSHRVLTANCIGSSVQNAVFEPGFLCQAVALHTAQDALVVKPSCEDFDDIEVFRLSISSASNPDFVNDYAQLKTSEIGQMSLGKVTSWRPIEVTTEFEREKNETLKAHTARGLLVQFDDNRRLLMTISGLPFFIQCFTDATEIDAELALLASY